MRKYAALAVVALILVGAAVLGHKAHAQTGTTLPPVLCYQPVHTSCAITAGSTVYALAGDGPFVSINGGAWTSMVPTPQVAGVTSWNGQTGAVTYTPPAAPVTSVNGKTGAVVITGSASAPQITLQ